MELEAHDRTTIDLPQVQHELFDAVMGVGKVSTLRYFIPSSSFFLAHLYLSKPTVLVLMNAGALAIDQEAAYVAKDSAPLAIIEAFYPGPHGGTALARGIFGAMNAWGRLPYTIYPKKFEQQAEMSEHDLRRPPGRTYRYYRDPLWAFGHGLTLTNWSLAATAPTCLGALPTDAAEANQACSVVIQVKNTGTRDGDAVVMAYWSSASTTATRGDELLTPIRQLFDFERVTVAAGATATVAFNVTARNIAPYADNGDQVAEEGAFALTFEDGGGARVDLKGKMVGPRTVLESFPSDKP